MNDDFDCIDYAIKTAIGFIVYNCICCCKQCFRLYKNTFCVAKCLLGECPKPL